MNGLFMWQLTSRVFNDLNAMWWNECCMEYSWFLNFVDDDTDTPISARAVDKLSMVWNGNCDLMYCVFLFSYMIIPQKRSEYSCRMLQSPMQVVRWCSQKYPLNVLTVFSSIRNTKIRRLALKPFRPFSVMLSMLLNPYCFFGTKFRQF